MRQSLSTDTVAQALREVKEYASRAEDINVDSLQMKLMHLDEMGRRYNHTDKELYSLVLQRFLCNKSQPRIGHLITSLLCSAAEAKIYEKEQKFLKLHGKFDQKVEVTANVEGNKNKESVPNSFDQLTPMFQFMQQFIPRFPTPVPPRSFFNQPRRGGGNARMRPGPNYTGCHICGDVSHFKVDCPRKQ